MFEVTIKFRSGALFQYICKNVMADKHRLILIFEDGKNIGIKFDSIAWHNIKRNMVENV